MSNSSRIEAATRDRIGQVLTAQQIAAIVKLTEPNETKGVYPGDSAGKRLADGTITHRGKECYGDLVLELVGANQYKVLATEEIVRRKSNGTTRSKGGEVVIPPPNPPAPTEEKKEEAPAQEAPKAPKQKKAA